MAEASGGSGPLNSQDRLENTRQVGLEDQLHWVWQDLSRKDAERKMGGLPDGTFLVLIESGDFTLVVRKNGGNRFVKIYCQDNRFRLASCDVEFSSLAELVEHYRNHSLASFNKRLDVYLRGALCKVSTSNGASNMYPVFKELYDLCQEKIKFQTRQSVLWEQHTEMDKRIKTNQLMVPALQTIQQLYQEQLSLQGETDPLFSLSEKTDEKYTNEVQSETEDCQNTVPSKSVTLINDEDDISIDLNRTLSREDEKSLTINTRLLLSRHSSVAAKLQNIKSFLDSDMTELRALDTELSQLEGTIVRMERLHEQLIRHMVSMGCEREFINAVLEPRVDTCEFDRSTWLIDCSREEAVERLSGLPHGSFLVRPKNKRQFPYALSIVIGSSDNEQPTIQHCHVVRPHRRGFGFNAALAVFESIDQLVLRHRFVSLKYYFKDLDASLAFPVGCQSVLRFSSACDESLIGAVDGPDYISNSDIQSTNQSEC